MNAPVPLDSSLPLLTTSAWNRRLEVGPDVISAPELLPPMRVVFAGGGTGGHLYPAIALARRLGVEAPGSKVLFLGSDRPLEHRILAPTGFPHRALPTAPFPGVRRPVKLARFAWLQLQGFRAARKLLKAWRPDAVVGLGGFPSVAPVLAARTLGTPVALFEPNADPGRANKLLARAASEAWVQWDDCKLACPRVHSGVPLGERVLPADSLTRAAARARLDLPVGRPTVLVMGGSQGSRALNTWILESLQRLQDPGRVAFIHLCGDPEMAPLLRRAYERAGCAHFVAPFLREIGLAYRAADLAVVRGGGATLAELLSAALPGVVVPMPTSAGDHQRHNAEAFAATGAGVHLPEVDLRPEALLRVLKLAQTPARLTVHRAHARMAGQPDAAHVAVRRLARLVHGAGDPNSHEPTNEHTNR